MSKINVFAAMWVIVSVQVDQSTSSGRFVGNNTLSFYQQNQYVAPESLKSRMKTGYRLLTGGGATNPYPRSLAAFQDSLLSMWEPSMLRILTDIQDGVRYILQTKNEWTLALHGTGSTATCAVLDNLVEPGEKVVVAITGEWGEIAANMSERLGGNVTRLRKPSGYRFSLAEIETALEQHRPQVLFLVNGESTSGVYQPMDGIGDLCIKYDCLFVADVIATVGQQPVLMDERKIDGVLLNSQKGCGSIVGLAPVSFSPRAVKKIQNRKVPPRVFQTDIALQARAWLIDRSVQLHHAFLNSISALLLYSLREGLARVVDEGIENVWKRHDRVNTFFHKKAEELGLKFYVPNPEDRLIGTTLFLVPEGKDSLKMETYILNKYRIEVSPGLGQTVGKAIRVGLFSQSADELVADRVIKALEDALRSPETNA